MPDFGLTRPSPLLPLSASAMKAGIPQLALSGVLLLAAPLIRAQTGKTGGGFGFSADATVAFDSNVFSSADELGDQRTSIRLGSDFTRQQGIIGIDGALGLEYLMFRRYRSENSWSPDMRVDFSKPRGKLSGKVSLRAYRTSQADSAVNQRITSWNTPAELDLKYSIDRKFFVSSSTATLQRWYSNDPTLSNYREFSEGLDLGYAYNSKLDFVGGYRVRLSRPAIDLLDSLDHSLTAGATGDLLPKLTGTVRFGYQQRNRRETGEKFNQLAASSSVTWSPISRLDITANISRDFATTAVGGNVDTNVVSLNGNYALHRQWSLAGGISLGRNRFLANTPARSDKYVQWDANVRYALNPKVSLAVNWQRLRNDSSQTIANFGHTVFSFNVATRY